MGDAAAAVRSATEHYMRVAQLQPANAADAYSDLGTALSSLGAAGAAADAYARAIRTAPSHAVAYNNLAALLGRSAQHRGQALQLYLAGHSLQPATYATYPQMHLNLGGVLVDAGRYDEALYHYGRGLRYEDMVEDTLGRVAHLSQRVCDWRGADAVMPPLQHSVGRIARRHGKSSAASTRRPALSPMHALTLPLTAHELFALSSAHAASIEAHAAAARMGHAHDAPPLGLLLPRGAEGAEGAESTVGVAVEAQGAAVAGTGGSRRRGGANATTLHVGFVSGDFKRHPVTILLAPALQALRRLCPRLRITLFALNPLPTRPAGADAAEAGAGTDAGGEGGADDVWLKRLRGAAHALVPLHGMPDAEAAAAIHAARVHILLDLNGLYTRGARPSLLAARPAPLQGTHLGYGASTGARFVDLVIGDRTALPPTTSTSRWYTERMLLLPWSHLPSGHSALYRWALDEAPAACCPGRQRPPAAQTASAATHAGDGCRADARVRFGLPPSTGPRAGIVYAYLGQHLKVDASTFTAWLGLLRASPRSVLWLLTWPGSVSRLRAAAAAAGISPSRLVFANRMAQGEHLCAFRLADLALDSPSYSSGATGIDVLWSGVPLLVLPGGLRDGPASASASAASASTSSASAASSSSASSSSSTIFQRNALSLASAALQPDLHAYSWPSYHGLGLGAMRREATRRALHRRARAARHEAPLFDSGAWARGFEDGMRGAWEAHATGSGGAHVVVARRPSEAHLIRTRAARAADLRETHPK